MSYFLCLSHFLCMPFSAPFCCALLWLLSFPKTSKQLKRFNFPFQLCARSFRFVCALCIFSAAHVWSSPFSYICLLPIFFHSADFALTLQLCFLCFASLIIFGPLPLCSACVHAECNALHRIYPFQCSHTLSTSSPYTIQQSPLLSYPLLRSASSLVTFHPLCARCCC